jgi:deoxyribodipyrimidine photo-lyase
MFKNDSLSHYKDTRNGLIGSEYSSKLSPWFANGSLSIRKAYHETQEYIAKNGHSPHTTHFISELFWRDFNKFWFVRYGNKGFSSYGIYDRTFHNWNVDLDLIQRWKDGKTGMPIIDAAMREMNVTGFMGNRARQFVASYLAMDLKQDWRYGAHHFEEKLVDHDVCSNYGGWNACAGIGAGMVRSFNTLKQSRDFDG